MTTIIGLTGQSGAGKSTMCLTLRELKFNIIDADMVTREVYENEELKQQLLVEFDSTERKEISNIVFNDKEKLNKLNEMIFPYIKEAIEKKIGNSKITVIDAPTLFESGFDKECDIIISVLAPRDQRINRIMQRDKISREDAEKRISSQHDDEFFKANSDYVIINNGNPQILRKKTFDLMKEII